MDLSDEPLTIGPAAAEASRVRGKYVAPSTVRDWANAGKIAHMKTPTGIRLFLRRDIEAAFGRSTAR
jgi:hypothetical protein